MTNTPDKEAANLLGQDPNVPTKLTNTNHTDRDERKKQIIKELQELPDSLEADGNYILDNYIPKPSPTKSSGELEEVLRQVRTDEYGDSGNYNDKKLIAGILAWHAAQTAKLQAEARTSEAKYIAEHVPKFYSLQEKDKWFDNRIEHLEKEYGVEGDEQ